MFWHLERQMVALQLMQHVVEVRRKVLDERHPDRESSEAWLAYFQDKATDNDGNTAPTLAAQCGQETIEKLLLDKDTIVDASNNYGNTTLAAKERQDTVVHGERLSELSEENAIEAFGLAINKKLKSLPRFWEFNRKHAPLLCCMNFDVDWDPVSFIKGEGYDEAENEAIGNVLTITGTANNAQALTCLEYLIQTWPLSGPHIIEVVKAVIHGGPNCPHTRTLPDGTELTVWMAESTFKVKAIGSSDAVIEVGQQFGWLGAALRLSPVETGLSYCSPVITEPRMSHGQQPTSTVLPYAELYCKISFKIEECSDLGSVANGQCWHNLLGSSNIVRGYPIRHRAMPGTGLEVPLDIMAELAQASRATMFRGHIFIKGFSTILVPTKHVGDLIVWHLLFNQNGSHISFTDSRVRELPGAHVDNVSFHDLEICRHIVGWCPSVKNLTGSRDAKYDIRPSKLDRPGRGAILEKISISVGKIVNAGGTVAIGKRKRAVHLRSRVHYVEQLKWIAEKYFILYDVDCRHGWLVDGASALLHLVRASLHLDQSNDINELRSAFLLDLNNIQEAEFPHLGKKSSISVLLNTHNRNLELYLDRDETWEEQVTGVGEKLASTFRLESHHIRFQDRVDSIYHALENIILEQAAEFDDQVAIELKPMPSQRRQLEGFDFYDIATRDDPFQPRVLPLKSTGEGWFDFVRKLRATTLFGRGFGELFQPENPLTLCHWWKSFPQGGDHIAACVSELTSIMKRHGSMVSNPWEVINDIFWHQPDQIFGPCQCRGKNSGSRCDRVQVLLDSPTVGLFRKPCRSPSLLEDGGAVIFGVSGSCTLNWEEHQYPVADKPSATLESSTAHVSVIDSSMGSSSIESNENPRALRAQLPMCDEGNKEAYGSDRENDREDSATQDMGLPVRDKGKRRARSWDQRKGEYKERKRRMV
ncbi:hypothetical protein CLAIMM_07079 [Cladophialophora immunda]|nr:hypothetical protein CLAIMM_07079 [Cladophialophora immunda]